MNTLDLVDELRHRANNCAEQTKYPVELMLRAAAEIERLRFIAGAVSAGDGAFREITKDLPRSDPSKHQVG